VEETNLGVGAFAPATYVRPAQDVLADVGDVARQTGDLSTLLHRLADLTLEATGADRVSLFLLDADRASLRLWSVGGRHPNSELWDLGLSMPAIALDDVPARRRLFEQAEAIAVPDADVSEIVPPAWVKNFQLNSLIVAPLRFDDETLGILVVDWRAKRDLPDELVKLVDTIARSCAAAVSHGWLSTAFAQRNASLQRLLDAASALHSPMSFDEVAERVAQSIVEVLGATTLSVHVFDDSRRRFRTLTQRNIKLPDEGLITDVPALWREPVMEAWRSPEHREPLVVDLRDGAAGAPPEMPEQAVVLPLLRPPVDVFGFIVLGIDAGAEPDQETLDQASALAAHVAFAIDRVRMAELVALGAEFARTVLALHEFEAEEPQGLLAGLRMSVPPALGFRIIDIRLAEETPASRPSTLRSPFERNLWKQWRRRKTKPDLCHEDGRVYAPVWRDDRLVALLAAQPLRTRLASHEADLLEALAAALGHAIERIELRSLDHRRTMELALAQERALVIETLQSTVGHMLEAIEISAEDLQRPVSSGAARERAKGIAAMAKTALSELRRTGETLPSLRYGDGGLTATLADVVNRFGQQLDAAADFEVRGEPRGLPAEVEQSLIRVLHEALARVERHGRASAIAVRLEYKPEGVEMLIRDDGIDLVGRESGDGRTGAHFGLRLMQRRITALGGDMVIEQPGPRGLEVRARVPVPA
jgi:signal transduction histidine kinase